MLNIITPVYNYQSMLNKNLQHYDSLPNEFKKWIQFIIVDDYSIIPISIHNDINLNIMLLRIGENIKWNVSGAKNLGMHYVGNIDEWCLIMDVDHFILYESLYLLKMLQDSLKPKTLYYFKRIRKGSNYTSSQGCFLTNKKYWDYIGGMDEDFASNYGYDDIFLKSIYNFKLKGTDFLPISLIMKENDNNDLDRDATNNRKLFASKMHSLDNGTYKITEKLRFNWTLMGKRIYHE